MLVHFRLVLIPMHVIPMFETDNLKSEPCNMSAIPQSSQARARRSLHSSNVALYPTCPGRFQRLITSKINFGSQRNLHPDLQVGTEHWGIEMLRSLK